MAQVTVKLEGVEDLQKFLQQKGKEVLAAGEKVVNTHLNKIANSARSKIKNISGETAASIKAGKAKKGKASAVGTVGTLGGTKEEAIRANSLEYGHAKPGDERGEKILSTTKHPFIRPAIDEDKKSFKDDMKSEIQKVVERG